MSLSKNDDNGIAEMQVETLNTKLRPEEPSGQARVEMERALLRKIDLRLMPLMMLICELL